MPKWMVRGEVLKNYLAACREADLNTFKTDPRITPIFEHCSPTIAEGYRQQVERDNKWLFDIEFTNDLYGGSKPTSPSTMQYIGVLSNLIKHFGPLTGKRIVEIGGGYGGQCRTIFDVYRPACYHIIDLPEVCDLQRRYCKADCFTEPTGEEYDLVISNYALSEIDDNAAYIRLARGCTHGYITCNTDKVLIPWEHRRLPDVKGERETNFIIVW